MEKYIATALLGGSDEKAASWLGISTAMYREWPHYLHPVMTDRVLASSLRKAYATAKGMSPKQYWASPEHAAFLEKLLNRVSLAAIQSAMMEPVPPEYTSTVKLLDEVAAEPRSKPPTRKDSTPPTTAMTG